MKVIDLTPQERELHLRFDSSPVYDFLAALYVVRHWTADRGFEVPGAWIARARARLGRQLLNDAGLVFPQRTPVLGLLSLLEDAPGSSVRTFLRRVFQTPAHAVVERMVGSGLAVRPALALLRRALAGDKSAREAFLAGYPRDYDAAALGRLLAHPPAAIKGTMLRVLREFYSRVYEEREAEVAPLLVKDVEERERLLGMLTPGEVVERITGGFVVTPGPGVAAVLLAPTFFFRPYNLITEYHGVRVFIYPLESEDRATGPPAELVRLYKALGDETRLRILRMLSDREMYVQEVAKALGVSHVTAIHHMAQLRAAHLVQAVERDNLRYFRLRVDATLAAERRWREYLKQ